MTKYRFHMRDGSIYHNYGMVIDDRIGVNTIDIRRAGDGLHRVLAMSRRTFDDMVSKLEVEDDE
jgi:hypothetical protein